MEKFFARLCGFLLPLRNTKYTLRSIKYERVLSYQYKVDNHYVNEDDFICLTDMAKAKKGDNRAADIIKNWIRTRTTIEFLGTWEMLYNPNFNVVEFDHFKSEAGLPTFVLSPKQ